MNLHFALGYKSNFNVILNAVGSGDPTSDNVDGFVDELSTFDKFKSPCATFNFAKPTDIISAFGLEGNVFRLRLTELNHYFSVAVDSFGVNIRVTVLTVPPVTTGGEQQGAVTV